MDTPLRDATHVEVPQQTDTLLGEFLSLTTPEAETGVVEDTAVEIVDSEHDLRDSADSEHDLSASEDATICGAASTGDSRVQSMPPRFALGDVGSSYTLGEQPNEVLRAGSAASAMMRGSSALVVGEEGQSWLSQSLRIGMNDIKQGGSMDAQISEARELLLRSRLSLSQEHQMQLFVGNFEGMQQKLQRLIERYVDDAYVLEHLMSLHCKIEETMELMEGRDFSGSSSLSDSGGGEAAAQPPPSTEPDMTFESAWPVVLREWNARSARIALSQELKSELSDPLRLSAPSRAPSTTINSWLGEEMSSSDGFVVEDSDSGAKRGFGLARTLRLERNLAAYDLAEQIRSGSGDSGRCNPSETSVLVGSSGICERESSAWRVTSNNSDVPSDGFMTIDGDMTIITYENTWAQLEVQRARSIDLSSITQQVHDISDAETHAARFSRNKFVPRDLDEPLQFVDATEHYFEVQISNWDAMGFRTHGVYVGMVTPSGSRISISTNDRLSNDISEGIFDATFDNDDVVGCGILKTEAGAHVFFTKNGMWCGMGKVDEGDTSVKPFLEFNTKFNSDPLITMCIVNTNRETLVYDPSRIPLNVMECPICWDEVAVMNGMYLQECGHFYCYSCLEQHIRALVDSGSVLDMACPSGCDLSDDDIRVVLSEDGFARFQQFTFLARLRLEPNCRWCPTTNCTNGVVGDPSSPDHPKLHCDKCDADFCFDCSNTWHPGLTCVQSEKKRAREEKRKMSKEKRQQAKDTERYFKKNPTRRCPRCNVLSVRESGCNHMTCRCGHEWCWLCGETIINVIGDEDYPLHYFTGACAGLQMSSRNELPVYRKAARAVINPAKYGLMAVGAVGAVAAGVVALGVAVPAAAVALPVYGGYRLAKRRRRKRQEKTNARLGKLLLEPPIEHQTPYYMYGSDSTSSSITSEEELDGNQLCVDEPRDHSLSDSDTTLGISTEGISTELE